MSNFDFGGGPSSNYPAPPVSHQFQTPPPAPAPPASPAQPGPPEPPGPPTKVRGIAPVGIIALLVMLVLVVAAAWPGNRVFPVNSRIDSAWHSIDGPAGELSDTLRSAGFTCSDEGNRREEHFHRICANYDGTSAAAVEFAGPSSGEIMRAYLDVRQPGTAESNTAAEALISGSVPDGNHRQDALAAFQAGPQTTRTASDAWGSAAWVDGTFAIEKPWTGPAAGIHIPGTTADVRAAAGQAGYQCNNGGAKLDCERAGAGAAWSLSATDGPEAHLTEFTLEATVSDPDTFDPVGELESVFPESSSADEVSWFVSTANPRTGQAGFVGGLRVHYVVELSEPGGDPYKVAIQVSSPCVTGADGVASC